MSFSPAARMYDGLVTQSPVTADLDGDGRLDIIVPLFHMNNIGVMLAKPVGGFGPLVEYPSGATGSVFVTSIAPGDFDGDGFVDLIVATGQTTAYLLRGTGTGGFEPPVPLALPAAANLVAAVDFDGDGLLDLVSSNDSDLTIFHGTGLGTFDSSITLPVGPRAGAPSFADLNADGLLDIFVANAGANTVSVILGVAVGPFPPPRVFVVGQRATAVVAADFDGDGKLDLAATNDDHGVTILLGSGTSALFEPPTFAGYSIFLPPQPVTLVTGDFDGDGRPDLALIDDAGPYSPNLFVLHGNGAGQFPNVESTPGVFTSLGATDLNRDGIDDLVTVVASQVSIIASSGGRLRLPETYPVGIENGPVIVADFNGDGLDDVGVVTQNGFLTFLATPGGGFAAPIGSQQRLPNLLAADMNRDGKPDLVWFGDISVVVALGNGDGTFGVPQFQQVGNDATAAAVGDLNGDGIQDLVVANLGSGSISILLGRGDGTFSSRHDIPVCAAPFAVVVADFNEDGKPDVAVACGASNAIAILLNDGTGGLGSPTFVSAGTSPQSLFSADFDGDGHLDLVVGSSSGSPNVSVLFGNGAGQFPRFSDTNLVGSGTVLAVGDLNGDGKPDLVLTTNSGPSFLINDGTGGFGSPVDYATGAGTNFAAIGDFDGDGNPDVAMPSSGTGVVSVLRNTNCIPRHLSLSADVGICPMPGDILAPAPQVTIVDDGYNVVACAPGPVSASIAPGTGTPGAVLLGTTSQPAAGGIAQFPDLAIDRAGTGYRLEFSDASAGIVESRTLSTSLSPAIAGPSQACSNSAAVYDVGPVYDSVVWTLDSAVVSHGRRATLSGLSPGSHTLGVSVTRDRCSASTSRMIQVSDPPSASISAPSAICPYGAGAASVPDAGPGAVYTWSAINAAITSGSGTQAIAFRAGPSGTVALSVVVTSATGCSSSGAVPLTIDPTLACAPPVGFFSVPPCRILDTRGSAGPYGGPSLAGSSDRTFVISGRCGIPSTARAVVVNVVAVNPADGGFLLLYPAQTTAPLVSTINYRAHRTRANNGILSLGAGGDLNIHCNQSVGTMDVVLDVSGYFE